MDDLLMRCRRSGRALTAAISMPARHGEIASAYTMTSRYRGAAKFGPLQKRFGAGPVHRVQPAPSSVLLRIQLIEKMSLQAFRIRGSADVSPAASVHTAASRIHVSAIDSLLGGIR
jgi:hypothetical protein